MHLKRKDPYLDEAIAVLDPYFEKAGQDLRRAYSLLSAFEQSFINSEIERCMTNFRYYAENYHVIPTEGEGLAVIQFWESQEIIDEIILDEQKKKNGKAKIICLKARQLGLCLDPKTKVLTADLRWIPIEEVLPGQELVSVDEGQTFEEWKRSHTSRAKDWEIARSSGVPKKVVPHSKRQKARKMRSAIVVNRHEVFEPAFRVTMDNGEVLTATGPHRFLCKQRGGTCAIWRTVREMKVGDEIRYITKPWVGQDYEDGWFGGMLDGEGSVSSKSSGAEGNVSQVQNSAYERALSYLQSRGYNFRIECDLRKGEETSKLGDKPVFKLVVSRMDELFRLIGQTRPIRHICKRWWEGKDLPGKNTGIGWSKIISIETLPAQRMIDIQTTTKTFIAEGFVSHNSTYSQARLFHKTIFTEACNSLVVAQDPDQVDYLFNMSRTAYECLPWWMRPEARYEAKGTYLVFDRKRPEDRLTNPGLRSQILCQAANKATGVGVGKTLRCVALSEISMWDDPDVLTKHIFPTMNASDVLGIMESTARGRNNAWHHLWLGAMEGHVDWRPVFIESYRVKKYFIPIPAGEKFEKTPQENDIHDRILKDKGVEIPDGHFQWRRKKIQESIAINKTPWAFFQEYPSVDWMEAFQGSGITAFNKERMYDILQSQCCEPLWFGEISLLDGKTPNVRLQDRKTVQEIPAAEGPGARLLVWEQPQDGEKYFIGVDVAMGAEGGDFSSVYVLKIGKRIEPDEYVAEWHGWINPTPLGDVVCAMAKWYNNCQIAVECNGPGLTTNAHIFRELGYYNIFRWKHYDKIKNFMTDMLGWWTNIKTRDSLITKFSEAIDDRSMIIRSKWLIDECLDFSADEGSARFEGQGNHDDRVFAAMIALFCAHDSDYGKKAAMEVRSDKVTAEERRKRDYYNTDASPIHDRPNSVRGVMHYERDVPAELIMYSELNGTERNPTGNDDSEEWKTF